MPTPTISLARVEADATVGVGAERVVRAIEIVAAAERAEAAGEVAAAFAEIDAVAIVAAGGTDNVVGRITPTATDREQGQDKYVLHSRPQK